MATREQIERVTARKDWRFVGWVGGLGNTLYRSREHAAKAVAKGARAQQRAFGGLPPQSRVTEFASEADARAAIAKTEV
jgi:hypothetical protein